MELKDRTMIVTGGGTGIGAALSLELGKAGANVVCVGRRKEKLDETVARLEAAGGRGLALAVDITQRDDVERMVDKTLEAFSRIDVLIDNAGSFRCMGPVHEADPDLWWADATVNLYGSFLCIRAVLPHMIERDEGIIINMDGGRPVGGTGYACSKAGLMELTRIMVRELQQLNSRVIVLRANPGLVRTAMTEGIAASESGGKWMSHVQKTFDEGRTREPEEIARVTAGILRIAEPSMSGAKFDPGTDVEQFAKDNA